VPSRSRQEPIPRSASRDDDLPDDAEPDGEGGHPADLADSDPPGSDPAGSDPADADPADADLADADLDQAGSDLAGSDLAGSDLAGSDLAGSVLAGSDLAEEDAMLPAEFGEFGTALIRDVVTKQFLRERLDAALRDLLRSEVIPSDFAADVTSARVDTVTLMSDDGWERCFAVTIGAQLEADVGPRLFAFGVDARLKIDLTVRVRAFRPATVGFDIDRVTPNDVWLRARTRSGWLPFSLGDGGVSGVTRTAQRAVPKLCTMVNVALEEAIDQRRIDVLAHLNHYGDPTEPDPAGRRPRAGREIDFAELGQVLMRRGVDRRVVAAAVATQLDEPISVELDEPVPVSGTIGIRLAGVSQTSSGTDELRFRLILLADAELLIGEGDKCAPATATVRADVRARLTTGIEPATLVIEFEPVKRLRVVRARRAVRGRMMVIPAPNQTLAPLRRRVTEEVNQRLEGGGVRLVVSELVDRLLRDSADKPAAVPSRH
jgi:hypothetical protein